MNPCPLAGDQGSLPLDNGLKESGPRDWIRTDTSQRLGLGPLPSWATRGRGRGSRDRTDDLLAENQAPLPTWPYPLGGSCRTRTGRLLRAKQALFQPELRTRCGEVYGIRTRVLVIDSDLGTARLP